MAEHGEELYLRSHEVAAMLHVRCSACRQELPPEAFPPDMRASNGLQSQCRSCKNAADRARRAQRPPKEDVCTFEERLFGNIEVGHPAGCWWWTGTLNKGYGVIGAGRRGEGTRQAHRAVFELLVGLIPSGLTLDHLCRNPRCCNPNHLEPVTSVENVRRGYGIGYRNAIRTACNHGHPFTPDNIYWQGKYRICRTCALERSRRRHAERRAAA
jgi:hypothetical protein